MSKWYALFLASRPVNLLIMAYTMAAMCWGVIMPALAEVNFIFELQLDSNLQWLVAPLILSIILLAAGGNIINDIEDVGPDQVNERTNNQIGKALPSGMAMTGYQVLTIAGLLVGILTSYLVKSLALFSFHLFIAGSLWYYSRMWQRQFLMGNVVVSILTALLPLMVFAYAVVGITTGENAWPTHLSAIDFGAGPRFLDFKTIVFFYSGFAFLSTLMREIVKDMQDVPGDRKAGYKTLAIQWGESKTSTLVLVLTSILMALTSFFSYFVASTFSTTAGMLIAVILLPIMGTTGWIMHKKRPDYLKQVSGLLKLIMFFGITTAWFFLLF